MSELNISAIKPENILRKESFRRAMPVALDFANHGGSPDYDANKGRSRIQYCYPTQDDFLREFDPNAHQINSLIYYPNIFQMDKQSGTYKMKVRSRVSVAWQRRIHTKRVVALTGYDPDITISKSKTDNQSQEMLKLFKEGWSDKRMDSVIHLAIKSDLKVGDVAVLGYKDGGSFGTRIFAYDKGDTLYPHFDPMTGKLVMFGRLFSTTEANPRDSKITENVDYLDVWDDKQYIQYKTIPSWEREDGNKDTWKVSVEPKSHNFPFCPIAYHRYGEPCWAASQSLIEQNELSLSQLAENNAQFALRILYTLGAEFEMEGSTDGTPTAISSSDPNAKIGFLDNADKSESYELELNTQAKEIMRCSFAVETPELKSGSDLSSLTVKMLNADSYLKALDDAKEYQEFLDCVTEIFAEGYGTEIGKQADLTKLKATARLQPWTFMSESEVVNTLVQLVSIGVLSKRSATEYAYETLGLGSIDEAERVLQEAHDELVGQSGEQTTQRVNTINNARTQQ